jgi:glutamate--cysteine ligase
VADQLKNYNKIILPDLDYGWHKRRKSNIFTKYDLVVKKFCEDFDLDPFFITTIFKNYKMVNFKDKQSLEEIALGVDKIIEILKYKYQDYNIKNQPYVFLKSDMGTYGMGIMIAHSGDDILKMNKIAKNKMAIIKDGVVNNEIIIQEGIHTIEQYRGFPSEKMIYCVAGSPVAEIDRFNEIKDTHSNLNSNGMKFEINSNYQYNSYSLVAQLASLAVCFELS